MIDRVNHATEVTVVALNRERIDLFPVAGENDDVVNRIDRSVTFMRENLNRPLQVAALAALANVSISHYFAMFKRRMGLPPIDYFTRMRMQRACELLDSTPASIKEVSVFLGYEDPFYFSRVFKAVCQVSPSQYRARQPRVNGGPARHRITLAARSRTISL